MSYLNANIPVQYAQINKEKNMDHIKKVITWASTNKQKSVVIAIVVIAIYFLAT